MHNISKFKGQWFILSAIFASIAFLAISNSFQGYYQVDNSAVELEDAHFYLESYLTAERNLIESSTCDSDLLSSLNGLGDFAKDSFFGDGVVLITEYDTDCSHMIYVSTTNMEAWDGSRPEISSVSKTGSTLTIEIEEPVFYDFDIKVDTYDNAESYYSDGEGEILEIDFSGTSQSINIGDSKFVVLRSILIIGDREYVL